MTFFTSDFMATTFSTAINQSAQGQLSSQYEAELRNELLTDAADYVAYLYYTQYNTTVHEAKEFKEAFLQSQFSLSDLFGAAQSKTANPVPGAAITDPEPKLTITSGPYAEVTIDLKAMLSGLDTESWKQVDTNGSGKKLASITTFHTREFYTDTKAPDGYTLDWAKNDAPVADSSSAEGQEDGGAIEGTVTATDPEGDPLTFELINDVTSDQGTLQFAPDGSYSFTPAPNFNGTVTFTYQAFDGELYSAPATVTLTVNAVADLSAADDSFTINEDGSLSDSLGDTTTSGGSLSYALDGQASNGTATVNADGTFTYVPAANFNGTDSFTYTVTDAASGESSSQTVTVTVNKVNGAPVITSNGGGTTASISLSENIAAVTTVQAADPDGDILTYQIVGGADEAKFSINSSTGALSFVTAPDFEAPTDAGLNNTYEVKVRAFDGTAFDEQTITVQVTNVADTEVDTGGNSNNNSTQKADPVTLVNGVGQVSGSVTGNDSDFFKFVTLGNLGVEILPGDRIVLDLDGLPNADVSLYYVDNAGAPQSAVLVTQGVTYDAANDVLTYNVDSDAAHSGGTYFARVSFAGTGGDYVLKVSVTPGIVGTSGADNPLNGTSGADTIVGGAGNDSIFGLDGADFIYGEAGKDTMTGGAGADKFVFTRTSETGVGVANADIITDFKAGGELDVIDLSAIDPNSSGADDAFTFAAGPAGRSVWVTYESGNTIVHVDTNNNSADDEMTIVLTGTITLSASDFVL
jgi:Ca2+-binding RTX toxin-like protein